MRIFPLHKVPSKDTASAALGCFVKTRSWGAITFNRDPPTGPRGMPRILPKQSRFGCAECRARSRRRPGPSSAASDKVGGPHHDDAGAPRVRAFCMRVRPSARRPRRCRPREWWRSSIRRRRRNGGPRRRLGVGADVRGEHIHQGAAVPGGIHRNRRNQLCHDYSPQSRPDQVADLRRVLCVEILAEVPPSSVS